MDLSDRQRQILEIAEQHGDKYLLPRIVRKLHHTDAEYVACAGLVAGGYARWLGFTSSLSPGIRLTGKPLSTQAASHPCSESQCPVDRG